MSWVPEMRDGCLEDFGSVLVDAGEHELSCDEALAKALGWDTIPTDDSADPYGVLGLVRGPDGDELLICSMSKNVAIGKDYTYAVSFPFTSGQSPSVKNWMADRLAKVDAARVKSERIQQILRENELDDESIRRFRKELLEKHGLA